MFLPMSYISLLLFLTTVKKSDSKLYAYVEWRNTLQIEITVSEAHTEVPEYHVAKAVFSNEINETGWASLELHTSQQHSDEKQAFGAGYLEGYLTKDLIWMHWQNVMQGYCDNKTTVCRRIKDYVNKNNVFITERLKEFPNDPYWYQIKLYYSQLEGLAAGYKDATSDTTQMLTPENILWLNMLGDLEDLETAFSPTKDLTKMLSDGHCSALVKMLPDQSNLYVSHDTWNTYNSMLRIQKKYVLHYKLSPDSDQYIVGHAMTFSSYPGMVQSADDFYVISTGLVTLETTIGYANSSLNKYIQPKRQVMEFVRSMVANRLAKSGKEWVMFFKKYNSGTYNNQWIIVDYKRFTPGNEYTSARIKSGLLWILEQIPGFIESKDKTKHLVKNTYWPSFNIAFFSKIFNMSGGVEEVTKCGEWCDYKKNPRARIFQQRQSAIYNIDDMMTVMRYNDYLHDPLSACSKCVPPYSAWSAISARNDLNPANGTYPIAALGHRNHGGTDTKITSWDLVKDLRFVAVSGPTHNMEKGVPPFKWSHADFRNNVSHIGHPDEWVFKPVTLEWHWGQ